MAFTLFSGCSAGYTASIRVMSEYYNEWFYYDDDVENPEPPEEPTWTEYEVKKGDKLEDFGIEIVGISEDTLTIKMDWEFFGTRYDADGYSMGDSASGRKFSVGPGETLDMNESGICDASHVVKVECVEIRKK